MENTDCRMETTDDEKECASDESNSANVEYSSKHGNGNEREYTPSRQERQYAPLRHEYRCNTQQSDEERRRFHQTLNRYNKCRNVTSNDITLLKYYGFLDSEENPTSEYYKYMKGSKYKMRRNHRFSYRKGEFFCINRLEKAIKDMQATLYVLKRNLHEKKYY